MNHCVCRPLALIAGVVASGAARPAVFQRPRRGDLLDVYKRQTLFVIKGFFDTSIVGTWIESVDVTGNSASSDEASKVDVCLLYTSIYICCGCFRFSDKICIV